MKFEIFLDFKIKKEWEKNYIDYSKLQNRIEELNKKQNETEEKFMEYFPKDKKYDENKVDEIRDVIRKNSSIKRESFEKKFNHNLGLIIEEFISELDFEIKKFHMFYKILEKKIYKEVNLRLKNELNFSDLNLKDLFLETVSVESICFNVKELCEFVNINVMTVKNILIEFDTKFNTGSNPVALFYLGNALEDPQSALLYILKFKCIDDSSALIERLLQELEYSFNKRDKNSKGYNKEIDFALHEPLLNKEIGINEYDTDKTELFQQQINKKFSSIREKLEKIDESNDLIRSNLENWSLVVQNSLRSISDKQKEFKIWKNENKKILAGEETIMNNLLANNYSSNPQHIVLNIWFCLIHTMLNSLNTTIVLATNSSYISSIGVSKFMTGIVLGCTHLAAIILTFYYSKWTNLSYRQPLLFSCIAYLFGNLLYASAGKFGSIIPMMLGRFLIGVGSARVVNRRYLIDHVEPSYILHFSMLYVVMTSLGNVLGPLCSIFLLYFQEYEYQYFELSKYTWPAWVCFIMWIFVLSAVYIFFKDPVIVKNEAEEAEAIEHSKQTSFKELEFSQSFTPLMEDISVSSNKVESNNLAYVEKDIKEIIKEQETSIFSYMSFSFFILVAILCLIRMVSESLTVSASIYLNQTFNYDIKSVAYFLAFSSFLVIPASFVINKLFKEYQERKVILTLTIVSCISSFFMLSFEFFEMSLVRFYFFFSVLFVLAYVLESFTSALLAKIYPPNLTKNIFNSGFAITFSTTGGKMIGAILVTVLGTIAGRNYGNYLYGLYFILFGLVAISVYLRFADLRIKAIARIIQRKNY